MRGASFARLLAFLLALAAIAGPVWAQAAATPLSQVRVRTLDPPGLARQLKVAGFDILEGSLTANSLDVVVGEEALRALAARGLQLDVVAVGRPFRELEAERMAAEAAAGQVAAGGVPAGYPSLSQINATLAATAAAHPAICAVRGSHRRARSRADGRGPASDRDQDLRPGGPGRR